MANSIDSKLATSLETGFIDYAVPSAEDYRPRLILNNPPTNNVLSALCREIEECVSFEFSVAFITREGLAMLLQPLYEAQGRKVQGKILTSDYLNFTEPEALSTILKYFPNIELRVYSGKPFHAKGYLFYRTSEAYTSLIIGSSNLTATALATTREWNIRLASLKEGDLLRTMQAEFNDAWECSCKVSSAWITQYSRIRKAFKNLPFQEEYPQTVSIHPNIMQKEALQALATLRQQGKRKAMLISATGTGKTFLSALDVKAFQPKRFLFIVHRQQIASESLRSFKKILGENISCGLLGGGQIVDKEAQYIFAMIQTLSKDEVLSSFAPESFDYIVVDEVHRAGAHSYEKVLSYFTPKFLLGMTATPERTDGYDIYQLFDHTIAYEIRLNQALEADLLAPFHYYGISDLSIAEKEYDDVSLFSRLEEEEWVAKVKSTIDKYSLENTRRRGLIFCSRNRDALLLSQKLSALGLKTLALSGNASEQERDDAFTRLEQEELEGSLEYLIAVDIFNEGIDIPSLNQIIMLRPTQSAIIFVQQMGRGLRKHPSKDFLTVIDFIGNYRNNYMIPIALFGDTSYKKDSLRKLISSGSLAISGVSTVNFDRIAKERIYKAINEVSFKSVRILKKEYNKVRTKLGRVPRMMDFIHHGAISPLLFIDYSKNYYTFKSSVEDNFTHQLQIHHLQSLDFLSKVVCSGIRPYEGVLIEQFVAGVLSITLKEFKALIKQRYAIEPLEGALLSAIHILQNGFYQAAVRNGFGNLAYCRWHSGALVPTFEFLQLLTNKFYRSEVDDILKVGDYAYKTHFLSQRQADDFVLYHKYSRQDVCRLLGWEKDGSATLFGYRVHPASKTCPIFVTYHKNVEAIDSSIDYNDYFISPAEFAWETRTRVRVHSREVKAIEKESNQMRKLLFIQKNNDEGRTFYYMGDLIFLSKEEASKKNDKGEELPVVAMRFKMEKSVPPDLYAYITGKEGRG
ncbi:MAG: DEAD/DEAH box helicase [Sphaerochaetaceae bacterium]